MKLLGNDFFYMHAIMASLLPKTRDFKIQQSISDFGSFSKQQPNNTTSSITMWYKITTYIILMPVHSFIFFLLFLFILMHRNSSWTCTADFLKTVII